MKFLAPSLAISLLLSSVAYAADVGALAPGKPAGVRHAQDIGEGNTLLFIALGAAVIAGIAIAASSGDDNKPTQTPIVTTTTGTSV
jgi:hypothetical protein